MEATGEQAVVGFGRPVAVRLPPFTQRMVAERRSKLPMELGPPLGPFAAKSVSNKASTWELAS